MPCSGRERDGMSSSTSLSTRSTSPGRVGRGQAISPPPPIDAPGRAARCRRGGAS